MAPEPRVELLNDSLHTTRRAIAVRPQAIVEERNNADAEQRKQSKHKEVRHARVDQRDVCAKCPSLADEKPAIAELLRVVAPTALVALGDVLQSRRTVVYSKTVTAS